ncbi:MAG: hypothetical protein QOG53_539 [Frankiales bacterium]|jgi:hypothetical protein|nr:hypothetical protein [Frankiales bacterium]
MATGEGVFRFHRPDLSTIPNVPETREVWGGIEDQQPELGIDADTIRGNWAGEKLHLHYAVNVLMQDPGRTEDAEWTEAS